MKKSLIMAVLLTVISTVSFAITGTTNLSETSKFQIVENNDSRYDLYYVSENIDNVTVRILDANGTLINTDKLAAVKAFKRTYNLKDLPAGNYKIEVKNGEGKGTQDIFHNPTIITTLHTIVGQLPNENKFKVFVGPNDQNKSVEVEIFDNNGNSLIKETIDNVQKGFTKVYDLNNIKSRSVQFRIDNGKDQTSFTRSLK